MKLISVLVTVTSSPVKIITDMNEVIFHGNPAHLMSLSNINGYDVKTLEKTEVFCIEPHLSENDLYLEIDICSANLKVANKDTTLYRLIKSIPDIHKYHSITIIDDKDTIIFRTGRLASIINKDYLNKKVTKYQRQGSDFTITLQ